MLEDGRAWRALAYCLVKFPLAVTMAYLTVTMVLGGLLCLTCPIWSLIDPTGWGLLDIRGWGESWYVATTGTIVLLLFPWLLRLLVALDRRLVGALLAPGPAERRIARLETARDELRADAATTLRRLERDLHDGTQARLVSLGVTLSRIHQRLGRLTGSGPPAVVSEVGTLVVGVSPLQAVIPSARANPMMAALLERLRNACTSFRILGSYPTGPQLDRMSLSGDDASDEQGI